MDHEVNTTSWIALLEKRDRLIANLRHDLPDGWPRLVATFLRDVQPFWESLPDGVVLLLLTDVARELDRVAGQPAIGERPSLLVSLDPAHAGSLSANALCDHFDAAVCAWCTRLESDSLLPEVQAHRVAEYIDQHFAEPITLASLAAASGWCTRELSRAFRSSMRMSIRQYLQATRIDQAAARLRQGDKVESVVAAVGWRGRKNFFRHFKARVGTTPAQYRDGWTAPSARSETAIPRSTTGTPAPPVRHRSITRGPRTPRSPLFHNPASSSNCGTV